MPQPKITNESLRKSEERLRLAIRSGNIGLWDWDLRTNEVQYSTEWKHQIGYEDHEISNDFSEWSTRVHPDDLDKILKITHAFLEKSWPNYKVEFRIQHKDGSYRWVLGQAALELDADGKPVHMVGSQIDISERKNAELKEKIHHLVVETSQDGFWMFDTSGYLVEVNQAYADKIGYTREELVGMHVSQLSALASTPEMVRARIETIIKQGGYSSFETQHRHKDGHLIQFIASNTYLGEAKCIYSFLHDITERKKVEEALKAREERLQSLFDQASEGILLVSSSGKLIAANESFARMHGYTSEEMQIMNLHDLDTPEGVRMIPERMKRIFSGESLTFEVENYYKDGHVILVEVSARMIVIDGEPLVQSFVRDITERKSIEKKIQFLTQIYAAKSQVNHALIESIDETALFNRVCRIAVESGGMELAWIGVNDEKSGLIKPVAFFGNQTDYLENIVISSHADVPEGRGPSGTAFREKRSIFVQDFKTRPMLAHWRERIKKYGWGSSGTVSIIRGGKPYAVLVFYHTTEHVFTEETISLFNEMGVNIGRGLDRIDLEAEKVKAEESMRLAAAIYESSAEAVMVTDENNRFLGINPAFTRITGYTLEEVAGKSPNIMQSGKHDAEFYGEMWQALQNEGHWQGEIWDRRKGGELYAKWANISVIRHADGSVYRHVAQFSDVTEKKQKDALIQHQADYDFLTELPNRRLFLDRLEQEIKRSNRTRMPLALLYLDLDHFKEINDTLGHAKGDILLVEAARRISQCVRETDTVARLGGDEFTVMVPEFGGRLHLERIAQDIVHSLAKPFDLGAADMCHISASIGITLYPDDAQDIENLLIQADQAMYAAKAEGRNRFGYFTKSMQIEVREKLALTNDLRQALARNELHVYYQPILELGSGRITKAEALLRWKHPTRSMVSPAIFIPLAEESGLIHEIGGWLFQQAIAQVADWHKLFGRVIQISVNKSPVQFDQPERFSWASQMKELGLPGNAITVEITEGLLIKDSFMVKQRLLEFRNSGIEVSIDDFGTGFSSLSYLKQFDIDYLKIDRSFVKELDTNPDDKALTEAIIVMAHKLGIKTIAEGVETEAQRDLLKSFGCDYAQGFLYSPAVPSEEFGQLIARQT